jgi:ureidoglycolate lyase
MHSTVEIKIEPLTAAEFSPFGELLVPRAVPSFSFREKDLHRFAFAADSPTVLQILSFKPQPLIVRKIERHAHVTESRYHVGGAPTVIVVAAPSEEPPAAKQFRAFLVDRQGVLFKPGTWHCVDAFPIEDRSGDFLFLSDKETQSELFDNPVQNPRRSRLHDFSLDGVTVKLVRS